MGSLEFKSTGDWKLQGSSEKELYISLVAKIDDWKKNIVFRRSMIGEAFTFLLQSILENKELAGWEFSISTKGGYMNNIYVSQIFWIKDQSEEKIFMEGKG